MKTKTILITLIIAVSIFTCNTPYVSAQWVAQNPGITDTLTSVFFVNQDTGYACGVSWGGPILLKTTNGGSTWVNQNFSGTPFSVFFTDVNTGYISGMDTIYKTVNGGAYWSKMCLNVSSNFAAFSVYFYNSNIGFITGMDLNIPNSYEIFITTNGGYGWSGAGLFGNGLIYSSNSFFATSPDTCYVVACPKGMNKSTNGGITWNEITQFNSEDLLSVFFTSATTGFTAGHNDIYRTMDAGNTWNVVHTINGWVTSIYFTSAATGYAVGHDVGGGNSVLRTLDGGTTWNPMSTPTGNKLNCVQFPIPTTGYAVGDAGTILKYEVPVGIEEANSENSLIIYPNPANDFITVSVPDGKNIDLTINIYNIIGELVKTTSIKQLQKEIDISDLNNGIYVVELKSQNWSDTKKLTIQK